MEKQLILPNNFSKGLLYNTDPNIAYYDPSASNNTVPCSIIFNSIFNCIPSIVRVMKPFTEELINHVRENGKLISEDVIIQHNTNQEKVYDIYNMGFFDTEDEYTGFFLYKNCIIQFDYDRPRKCSSSTERKDKLYTIKIYFKPGNDIPLEEFEKYLYNEDLQNVIHAIFRDDNGSIRFEPFETSLPEKFDIEKLYSSSFKNFHSRIISSLNKNKAGLYLLHGDPGTGKTTYIKYLASQIDRDVIYLPVSLIDTLSDPSFLLILLKKRNSILIIEDAEKALLSRDGGAEGSPVSSILNLTDGIMGDIYNISIIATYNSPRQDIDKALLRKGRIKGEYRFDKLPIEHCQKILDENNINVKAVNPMTLAEIFNMDDDETILSEEMIKERKMGF